MSNKFIFNDQVIVHGLEDMRDVEKQIHYENAKGYNRIVSLTYTPNGFVLVME